MTLREKGTDSSTLKIYESRMFVVGSTFLFMAIVFGISRAQGYFEPFEIQYALILGVLFAMFVWYRLSVPLLSLTKGSFAVRTVQFGLPLILKGQNTNATILEISESRIRIAFVATLGETFVVKKKRSPVIFERLLDFIVDTPSAFCRTEEIEQKIRNLTKFST